MLSTNKKSEDDTTSILTIKLNFKNVFGVFIHVQEIFLFAIIIFYLQAEFFFRTVIGFFEIKKTEQ